MANQITSKDNQDLRSLPANYGRQLADGVAPSLDMGHSKSIAKDYAAIYFVTSVSVADGQSDKIVHKYEFKIDENTNLKAVTEKAWLDFRKNKPTLASAMDKGICTIALQHEAPKGADYLEHDAAVEHFSEAFEVTKDIREALEVKPSRYLIGYGLGAVVHYTHATIIEASDRDDANQQAARISCNEPEFENMRGGISYDVFEIPANVEDIYAEGVANEIAKGRLKPSAIGQLFLDAPRASPKPR